MRPSVPTPMAGLMAALLLGLAWAAPPAQGRSATPATLQNTPSIESLRAAVQKHRKRGAFTAQRRKTTERSGVVETAETLRRNKDQSVPFVPTDQMQQWVT